MKARYTRQARLAVRQIILSIAEHSPSGAQAVSKRIERGVRLIEDFSRAGVDTSLPRVRKLSLTPYPYIIFYTIQKNHISILAVRHAARRPLTWKDEWS